MSYLLDKLIMIPIVLISLTFHEFSHGWVSSKLGDPTPRATGRLTLNPMSHLDPLGAVLMVLTGFGWAKPVQINARYYKNPKWGMAITAAAGPLSNLLLAFVSLLIYTLVCIVSLKTGVIGYQVLNTTANILVSFAYVNLCFMIFNLIPIPPLDGSRIAGLFLSNSAYFKLQRFEQYSFIVIIALSLLNVFDVVIGTGVNIVLSGIMSVCSALAQLVI